jgi:hypothetical protein
MKERNSPNQRIQAMDVLPKHFQQEFSMQPIAEAQEIVPHFYREKNQLSIMKTVIVQQQKTYLKTNFRLLIKEIKLSMP